MVFFQQITPGPTLPPSIPETPKLPVAPAGPGTTPVGPRTPGPTLPPSSPEIPRSPVAPAGPCINPNRLTTASAQRSSHLPNLALESSEASSQDIAGKAIEVRWIVKNTGAPVENSTTAPNGLITASAQRSFHLPNLVLENIKVDGDFNVCKAIKVRWFVKNAGAAVENSTTAIFLDGGPNSIAPMRIGEPPSNPHPNGWLPRRFSTHEHGTPNLIIPEGVTPGAYELIVWVDADNQVEESNENDNKQVFRITILP